MDGKNSFYLPKYRYLELKYFCRQYPYWRYLISCPEKCPKNISIDSVKNAVYLVEKTLYSVNCDFLPMLLHKITNGGSYEKLIEKYPEDAPNKEDFVAAYKLFFWLLSQEKQPV